MTEKAKSHEKDDKAKELGAVAKVFDGDKVCYFKPASRMAVGIFGAMWGVDRIQACETLFDDACIKEISDWAHWRNDNGRFFGITTELQQLIEVKKSTWMTL